MRGKMKAKNFSLNIILACSPSWLKHIGNLHRKKITQETFPFPLRIYTQFHGRWRKKSGCKKLKWREITRELDGMVGMPIKTTWKLFNKFFKSIHTGLDDG